MNIVVADQGWILERCAREIESRLSYVTVQTRPDPTSALNYYVNYSAYREPQPTLEIGFFTHIEERDAQAARRFFDVARKMDDCVCMSTLYADRLKEAGINAVHVITPGVDLNAFQPKVKIGVVGRTYHTGRKGEDLIASLIDEPGIEWHFTGSGWPRPAKHYPNEAMPDFYNSVDYILVSAYYEGGPMTVLEALACGKPVIAPPIGFVSDYPHIEYRTGDIDDLRRVLQELVSQRLQLRRSVAHRSWDNWAAAHDSLFRTILAPKRPIQHPRQLPSLKVLMALHAPENVTQGGPSVRVGKTAQHLRKLDIQVDITSVAHPDADGYDLVHVFNVWEPHAALHQLQHLRRFNIPIVLSPIYLDLSESVWASLAIPAIFSQSESPETLNARLEQATAGNLVVNEITRQGINEIIPGYHAMVKQIVDLSDYLIGLSEYEMAHLWKLGIPPRSFTLVPNGADPLQFQSATGGLFTREYGLKDYILCVGRIESRKNQLMLAYAVRDLDLSLVFIGNSFEPHYLELVRKYAGQKTIFVEHLPNNSAFLASAYAGARVFALPSWSEGAPLTALEAAAAGCPLVLSDRSGASEYFGDLATYCDPGDVSAIRQAVNRAYHDSQQQSPSHAQRLKNLIQTTYNWSEVAAATARAYRNALASFQKSARPRSVPEPRKLEVGSGTNPRPGYEHLDVRADLPHIDHVHDINEPLPFPDATFDEILARSCLEHISWRRIADLLRDWRRALKPGGKLEIWMPDLEYLCRMYLQGQADQHLDSDYIAIAKEKLGTYSPATWAMLKMFAGQDYPDNFHKAVYDFTTFASVLRLAKFENIQRIPPHHGLHVIAHRPLIDIPSLDETTTAEHIKEANQPGPVQRPTPIAWAESIFTFSGYSRLSRQTILSLYRRNTPIAIQPFAQDKSFLKQLNPDELATWRHLLQQSVKMGAYVCFHPPTLWDGRDIFSFYRRQNPGFDAYIGITMFETDRLPAGWAESCNRMDEVWVPSSFNRETFARAGVDPNKLQQIPFGIDAHLYDPVRVTPLDIPRRRGFTFLSVFQWSERKGWDILIKAYLSAFSVTDDVCLVLRTYPGNIKTPPLRKRVDSLVESLGYDLTKIPPIILVEEFVSEAEMPALYAAADAFVLPTRGEGWGIPLMEAMAMGLPTLATRWSAHLDFMNDDNSFLIDIEGLVKITPAQTKENPFYTTDQRWAEPSLTHTAELMRNVYDQRGQAKAKGIRARRHIQTQWSLERTAEWIVARTALLSRGSGKRRSSGKRPTLPATQASSVPAPRLKWHGPIYDLSGYADEARNFILNLQKQGFDITAAEIGRHSREFRRQLDESTRKRLDRMLTRQSVDGFISVIHFPAYAFKRVPGASYNIGRVMFETDGLPTDWVSKCNQMDEIWVPSDFNIKTFRKAGVTALLTKVPGGIDTSHFKPRAQPLSVPNLRKTVFISMFVWQYRKGWDILLRAWTKAFNPDDDVTLILRSYPINATGIPDAKQEIENRINFFLKTKLGLKRHEIAPIIVLSEQIAEANLPGFYATGDVYVSCSRGEGWGRPQMQAMACGLPVIATNWSGNLEFMNKQNSLLLAVKSIVNIDDRIEIPFFRGQKWAEPSASHLAELMQWAHQNPKEAATIGKKARQDMVDKWQWQEITRIAAQRLKQIQSCLQRTSTSLSSQSKPISVKWEGTQFVHHSLALINREICLKLIQAGYDLAIIPYEKHTFGVEADNRFMKLSRRFNWKLNKPADIHIRHQWPPNFTPPREGHWVIIQPWEFGSLPKAWIEPMSQAIDEIWVPSSFVRECYIKSGVPADRVFVVPNGVNTRKFRPGLKPFPLDTKKRFKFLFVGGTIYRKGIDLLLEAYCAAFTARDDVCLVIKDMGGDSFYKGQTARQLISDIRKNKDAPEIEYIDRMLTEDELASLYNSCNCLAHPYRGEGFGLPIAEAMACGLPVIVTGYGAALDFCSQENAYLLPARLVRLPEKRIGNKETVDFPWLAEPDLEALKDTLRQVLENPDEAVQKGRAGNKRISRDFTWDNTVKEIIKRIDALRVKPILRFQKPVPSQKYAPRASKTASVARSRFLMYIEEGRKAYHRGDLNEAVALLLQAVKISALDLAAYHTLVEILLDSRNYKDALEIISEFPDGQGDVKSIELTGYCKEGLGLDQEASALAEKLLTNNPGSAPALNLKGILAHKRGEAEGAEDFFRKAMEADPAYGEPCTNLGVLLWEKDIEKALALIEKGFILSPTVSDIISNYHHAITQTGRFERGANIFGEACQLHPDHKLLRYKLIDLLLKQGKNREAMEHIEEAMVLFGVDDGMLAAALKVRDSLGVKKIPKGKGKNSVSLCMIVKDEEKHLARCLQSVKPIVDEMVVVDTGSTDRTKDIAKAFGARVYDFQWNDDFSEARNYSISKAKGQWIFVMDADEVISPLDYKRFRKLTRVPESKKTAFSFETRNYTANAFQPQWRANDGKYEEEEGEGWTPTEKVRLFPRNSAIRYDFPIHEVVEPSLNRLGIALKDSKVPVHHYGALDRVKSLEKKAAYYEIGKKKLEKTGDTDIALRELAVQAEILGKHEKSIEFWERFIAIRGPDLRAYINMGISYAHMGKFDALLQTAEKALKLDPFSKEALYNFSLAKLHLGQPEGAVSSLEKLLERERNYPPAQFLLAAALCCAGEKIRASTAFEELGKTSLASDLPIRIYKLAREFFSKRPGYTRSILDAAMDAGISNGDMADLYSKALEETDEKISKKSRQVISPEPSKQTSPSSPGAGLLNQAEEARKKGLIDEASKIALKAIGEDPDDKRPYLFLARIMIDEKRFKDALDVLDQMPEGDEDVETLALWGYSREGMQELDAAKEYAERALLLDPSCAQALNLMGLVCHQNGDIAEAEDFFNRAVQADPGYGEAYTNLGAVRWEKDRQGALELFEKAFTLSPEAPDVVANYHSAAVESGAFERAERVFERIISQCPHSKLIRYRHIDLLIKQEKHGPAMDRIEEAMARFGVDDGILSSALAIREMLGSQKAHGQEDVKPAVSLCMIVRNEEKHLARCLQSVKPIVDEMVVVDTGSTDRTKDTAGAFGARVYDFKWNDDFSAARNYSISKAKGQWIFVMDADEVISPLDYDRFRAIVRGSLGESVAYRFTTRNYNLAPNLIGWHPNDDRYKDEAAGQGWTGSDKVRLFRRLPGILFQYPVHELVTPSLERAGIKISDCAIPIHHYGRLNKEEYDRKGEAYYQMGRRKLDQMEKSETALRELAVQAQALGRYQEAIELWSRLLEINPRMALAHANMATAHVGLGEYEQAAAAAERACKIAPGMKEAHYNHAFALAHLGRTEDAIAILEGQASGLSGYPPARFLLAVAHCLKGSENQWKGRFEALGESMGPGFPVALTEFARGLVSAGRHGDALKLIDAAIETGNGSDEMDEIRSQCLGMTGSDGG